MDVTHLTVQASIFIFKSLSKYLEAKSLNYLKFIGFCGCLEFECMSVTVKVLFHRVLAKWPNIFKNNFWATVE
jgi:hypothetical protein